MLTNMKLTSTLGILERFFASRHLRCSLLEYNWIDMCALCIFGIIKIYYSPLRYYICSLPLIDFSHLTHPQDLRYRWCRVWSKYIHGNFCKVHDYQQAMKKHISSKHIYIVYKSQTTIFPLQKTCISTLQSTSYMTYWTDQEMDNLEGVGGEIDLYRFYFFFSQSLDIGDK